MSEPVSLVSWFPPGHAETVDLAVIIVSWNVREILLQNLEALFRSEGTVSAEVILIDNASHDGTAEAVRQRFPQVQVIANPDNRGFATANMQGLEIRKSRHALLLNPDMVVAPDALQKTVEYLDAHPTAAVASGKLTREDGSVLKSVRRFPDIWSQLAILFKLPHLFPKILDRYLYQGFDYDREQPVDSVRGSYFAMNCQALWDLGELDPEYFIWFEEVDYCKLAATEGWLVMHVPWIRAMDHVGSSFAQRGLYWKQDQFSRAMLRYFQKWHPGWRAWLIRLTRPLVLAAAWVGEMLMKNRRGAVSAPAFNIISAPALDIIPAPAIVDINTGEVMETKAGGVTPPLQALQLISFFNSTDLPALLESLRRQTFKDWELFVYEASENEDETRKVDELLKNSGLPYHLTVGPNIGYTAHNTLFNQNAASIVMLLNPDATLDPKYLEAGVAWFDQHPECASVTGLVYRETRDVIDTAGLEYRALGDVRDLYSNRKIADLKPELLRTQEVFGVSGALPLYRRSAVLLASFDGTLFDPTFFMYKEDVDLAIRLRRQGYTAWRVSEAVAFHRRAIKEQGSGLLDRIREERKRPMRLRLASYQNQWRIYVYHARLSLGFIDLARTVVAEAKRSAALFFLASPLVFVRAWINIFRDLPRALRRRKSLTIT